MRVLSKAFQFVLNTTLGCHHRRLTRPFTIGAECYMVCLDCGSQRFYSTESMRPLGYRESRRLRSALAASPTAPAYDRAPRAYPKPAPVPQPVSSGPWLVRRRNPKVAA